MFHTPGWLPVDRIMGPGRIGGVRLLGAVPVARAASAARAFAGSPASGHPVAVPAAIRWLAVALLALTVGCGQSAASSPPAPAESVTAGPSASAVTPGASGPAEASPASSPEVSTMPSQGPLTLTSPALADNAPIPAEYTCRGADVSPALEWTGVPAGAKALVLFVDDPDGRDWVHWSVLDIDPATSGLPRNVSPSAAKPQQGRNDFGKVGYGGPCPPSGTHHYRFTLTALAAPLNLADHPDGTAVRAALRGATRLGSVTLVGTFRA